MSDDGQTMDIQGTDSLLLTHMSQNALSKAKGLTVDAPTYMYEETGPQQTEWMQLLQEQFDKFPSKLLSTFTNTCPIPFAGVLSS